MSNTVDTHTKIIKSIFGADFVMFPKKNEWLSFIHSLSDVCYISPTLSVPDDDVLIRLSFKF